MNRLHWIKKLGYFGIAAAVSNIGLAQDNGDDLEELTTLSFTGTRLTGAEVEGSLPLVTYTQEDIAMSPATTPVEYLRDLPIIGGTSTQSSNFTNGTDGAARVGLRGIYGGNTLILLNGRRLTPSGTGSTPDLNQIPLAAVKQIDILKAGGSVTYGTSGVAGVINFILDDEFEGLEFGASYGAAEDGGGAAETTMNFIVGGRGAGGKFNFTLGGSYRKENDMMATDRPWMLGGGTSSTPNPGRFLFDTNVEDQIIAANGYTEDQITGDWTLKPGVSVASSPSDFQPWINENPYDTDDQGRNGNRFPYENYTIAINPNEQNAVFGTADYEINENWSVFSEFGYSYSELEFKLAPAPTAFYIPGSNYWMNQIFDGVDQEDDAYAVAYYRFIEVGPRINYIERRSLRAVLGVQGELPGNWNLEAYALYSDEHMDDNELNGGSETLVDELLALGTPDAYNFFAASWLYGTELGGGMINPENPNGDLADQVRADNQTEVFSKTELLDARISNNDLLELPAGPMEVVFGTEYRKQFAQSKPDALKLEGSLGWNAADGITRGGREVYGIYGEVGIPVITSRSGRYEDYKDEFTTDVFGANVRWQPISDLTLRASWSQGFVAPELIDIYNPGFGSFPELNDPYFGATDPSRLYQVETYYVGSQVTGVALKPENADIYSVGATYSPSFIEGLDITVDWWRLEKTDLIVYSVQGLVTEFRQSYPGGADGSQTPPPENSPYLYRNGGQIEYDYNDSAEPIQIIHGAGPRNVAGENIEGIDIIIRYRFDTDSLGTFTFTSDSSYTLDWEQQSATTGEWNSFIGEYDGDVAYPRLKSTLSAVWQFGDFTVGADAQYIGTTRDINVNEGDGLKTHVEEHIEVDFVVSYVLPFFKSDLQSTTLTVGVENAFDEMPPLMATAFSNNYPERNYDPRGRYWFVRINQSF